MNNEEKKNIEIVKFDTPYYTDAISRQAAIDAMREESCGCCWDAKDILAHLPSVNPQASKEDIHREREQAYMCGYEDASRKYRTEPSEDAISRQAAIDSLCRNCKIYHRNGECTCRSKCEEYHFLATIQTVTVQEKTGRWIYNGYYECSECGKTTYNDTYKYCPECGARMGEDGDKD